MTIEDKTYKLVKALQDIKPQQKAAPFQIVLVDIQKAANDKMVHCVQKSLEENDLKYVALSYRWGELHETLIDTGVGYTASITSFALDDFYQLCLMMTLESELKHIKYVWVDAICVDQQDATKREATLHQMSHIYERATSILAVPDLHLDFLKRISFKNNDTIQDSNKYCHYIYHLIHGNTDQLTAHDTFFLDCLEVPDQPPELRQLLLEYTDHFSDGLMKYRIHCHDHCPLQALDHMCEPSQVRHHPHWQDWIKKNSSNDIKETLKDLQPWDEMMCPFHLMWKTLNLPSRSNLLDKPDPSNWKPKILQRSHSIRQSMDFLTDLVTDWSTRVWVISEFNMANKKNNLKYWFTQLNNVLYGPDVLQTANKSLSFFKIRFS
ncbi:unnamed protein product [Absidia cylindrospora]